MSAGSTAFFVCLAKNAVEPDDIDLMSRLAAAGVVMLDMVTRRRVYSVLPLTQSVVCVQCFLDTRWSVCTVLP